MAIQFEPLGVGYAPPVVPCSSHISIIDAYEAEMSEEVEDIFLNDPRINKLSPIDASSGFQNLVRQKQQVLHGHLLQLLDSGITPEDLRAETDRCKDLFRREINLFLDDDVTLSESRKKVDEKMTKVAHRLKEIPLTHDSCSDPIPFRLGGALGKVGGTIAFNAAQMAATSGVQRAIALHSKAKRDFVIAAAKGAVASVPLDAHTWMSSLSHSSDIKEWARRSANFTLEQESMMPEVLKSFCPEFYSQVEGDLQKIAEITRKNVKTTTAVGSQSKNLPSALRTELLRSMEAQENSFARLQTSKAHVEKTAVRLVAIQKCGKIFSTVGFGLGVAAVAVLAPETILASGVIAGAFILAGRTGRVVEIAMSALTYYFFLPDEAKAPTE
jgi:hypothetical protein